jgi:hypothetical protein
MTAEVENTRKAERFTVLILLPGTFGPAEVTIANISVAGLQIVHPQAVRVGSRARISFHYRDMAVATPAKVIWSHLSKNPDPSGKLLYVSGLQLEGADVQFAAAVNSLSRLGAIRQDTESMERKKARIQEREEARQALLKSNPPTRIQ